MIQSEPVDKAERPSRRERERRRKVCSLVCWSQAVSRGVGGYAWDMKGETAGRT